MRPVRHVGEYIALEYFNSRKTGFNSKDTAPLLALSKSSLLIGKIFPKISILLVPGKKLSKDMPLFHSITPYKFGNKSFAPAKAQKWQPGNVTVRK